MKQMSRFAFVPAVLAMLIGSAAPARADTAQKAVYQVTLINVLPGALHHGKTVDAVLDDMRTTLSKEPGIVDVKITHQIGAPYNFTLIERWKDATSLDASNASSEVQALDTRLKPLLSGPVYRRAFTAFE